MAAFLFPGRAREQQSRGPEGEQRRLGGTAALLICETLLLLRVAKKIQNRTAGSNRGAALLSLTLYLAISLVKLATLDATARGAGMSADIGDHTALGIFSRLQVVDFDIRFLFLVSHVCYLSFVGLFVDCVLSVTPNGNRCPPVTSCFGIRSFKRINLSFLRLGL